MNGDNIELLVEDRDDGVRQLIFNRPDKLNALTPGMVESLISAVDVAHPVRSVVITGSGRAFCAGVDIEGVQQRQRSGRTTVDILDLQERFSHMALALEACQIPVIAAVNGPVAGAGLAVALASDIRIATPTAKFIIGAPNIGLSACESGISYFLPRLIGAGRASEIMLTNRPVGAEEALAIGLVTQIVPAEELPAATDAITARIAGLSPFGVRMTKQVSRKTIDAQNLRDAIELENRTQSLGMTTLDATEARNAFLDKRTPVFRNG